MPESAFTVMAIRPALRPPQRMTPLSGDVIFTGAPPGVGPIEPGDSLRVRISRLGEMEVGVR